MKFLFFASLALSTGLLAQELQFDVATLKRSPPPEGDLININLGTFRNGRFTMSNATLNDAIKFAYGLVSDAQLVGPDWNRSVRFDIVALAPVNTPLDDVRRMTRSLLAERLHLRLRREEKVLPHLALILSKSAPRFPASTLTTAPEQAPQVRGRISHPRIPISQLVTLLSRFERQIIIDHTGLIGFFEINLEWAPETSNPDAPSADKPGLLAAVQEQLGLRLEARKSALEILVVEEASKIPADN